MNVNVLEILQRAMPGIVLLGIVIFVHELGHFLAAKWRGVRVLRFSLGFGPALLKFERGGTEYRLSWIPLGGYVQMAGDSPAEDGSMPGGTDEYLSHPWYGRIVIAAAGPFANLVTAFLVLTLVAFTGVSFVDYPNTLGVTPDTSLAYQKGLRAGDRVTAVGAKPVSSWVSIFQTASEVPAAQPLALRIARRDSSFELQVDPAEREPLLSSLRRPSQPPVIGNVITGMPAYKAGLQEGDRILSVAGRPITTWDELPSAFEGKVDQPVPMVVSRGGRHYDITVSPIDPSGQRNGRAGRIGIEPPPQARYVKRHPFLESVWIGLLSTGGAVANVYGGMWITITRPLYYREYLGGPIFIAQAAQEQARRGADSYLFFLATINVAIMAFNLLPIPILDGGHILLALIQALRRRAISARGYMRFQKVGLVVVGSLLIFILANDPWRLVQRQRALDQAPQERQVAPNAAP
jgi:regulator of sigma E protease